MKFKPTFSANDTRAHFIYHEIPHHHETVSQSDIPDPFVEIKDKLDRGRDVKVAKLKRGFGVYLKKENDVTMKKSGEIVPGESYVLYMKKLRLEDRAFRVRGELNRTNLNAALERIRDAYNRDNDRKGKVRERGDVDEFHQSFDERFPPSSRERTIVETRHHMGRLVHETTHPPVTYAPTPIQTPPPAPVAPASYTPPVAPAPKPRVIPTPPVKPIPLYRPPANPTPSKESLQKGLPEKRGPIMTNVAEQSGPIMTNAQSENGPIMTNVSNNGGPIMANNQTVTGPTLNAATSTTPETANPIVLPSLVENQSREGTTILGGIEGGQALSPEKIYQDLDVDEQLQFLNYFAFEQLTPEQQQEFNQYAEDILADPANFEAWVAESDEPMIQEAYADFMKQQAGAEHFTLFSYFLMANGLEGKEVEKNLGVIAQIMQEENKTLDQVMNKSIATPALDKARNRLKSSFANFQRDFPALEISDTAQFQSDHQDRLHAMAQLARKEKNTALASQIYEQLLQAEVSQATISSDVQKKIDRARQELSNELSDYDLRQGLEDMGIEDPTTLQIEQARQATIDQVMRGKELEFLIGDKALDMDNPLVKEYKDMKGIGWFDLADDTKRTILKEAMITAVIGVATLGTGLVAGGILRGAALGGQALAGASRGRRAYVAGMGILGDTIGAQAGYSLSRAGVDSYRNGSGFIENFNENMWDPKLMTANGVSMFVMRRLQVFSHAGHGINQLSTGTRISAKAGIIGGASAVETAVLTGKINPADPQFARQFMFSALFNSFAVKQAKLGKRNIPNLSTIDNAMQTAGGRIQLQKWIKTPNLKNPFKQSPKTKPNKPQPSPSQTSFANRGTNEMFTTNGNLRYGRLSNNRPMEVSGFKKGETMGLYKLSRKVGEIERKANGDIVVRQNGKVVDTIPKGQTKPVKIDGDNVRLANDTNLTITKNPSRLKRPNLKPKQNNLAPKAKTDLKLSGKNKINFSTNGFKVGNAVNLRGMKSNVDYTIGGSNGARVSIDRGTNIATITPKGGKSISVAPGAPSTSITIGKNTYEVAITQRLNRKTVRLERTS